MDIKPWNAVALTGAPIFPVEIDRVRHFCQFSEVLPGADLLCGEKIPKGWTENPGDVHHTCPTCADVCCQIKAVEEVKEPVDLAEVLSAIISDSLRGVA